MSKLLSDRVRKVPSIDADPERYEFLDLGNAEPDLGVPLTDGQILKSLADGTRFWDNDLSINSDDSLNGDGTVENPFSVAKLASAVDISLTGDASGSVSFDGSVDVNIDVSISGFDNNDGGTPSLTGDIIGDVYASNGIVKILENGSNGTNATFQGNILATDGTTVVLTVGDGIVTPQFEGNADSADQWSIPRTVTFATGDITGSFSIDGSADVDDVNLTIGTDVVENSMIVNDSVTIGTTEIALGSASTTLAGLTQTDIGNIRINDNSISSTNTDGNIILNTNGAGIINASDTKITNLANPTNNTDAATKEYVDTIASASLHYHAPVRVETPSSEGSLDATYNNGTAGVGATLTANNNEVLIIDGVTLDLNDRVLVYNQTNAAHNGIYRLTQLGITGTAPWILTRTTDADSYAPSDPDALGTGDAFFVKEGNTGSGELYVMSTEGTITFGTTDIVFFQIGSSQIYIAGDALSLDGVTFNVNVDDTTIEVFGDALRVKDAGITNSKLENSFITIDADNTTPDPVFLGETLTFNGNNGISTNILNNVVTITNSDSGSTQNIIKSIAVTDTAGSGTYSETGIYNVASNNDTLTLESSNGIDIDIDTVNGIIRFQNTQPTFKTISVSGQNDIVADNTDDTLTFVAGNNINIVTDETTDTITINALSSTQGDNAFDNITDTVATVNSTVIDSFSLTTYRSAKYYIQISQGSDYQISELMVIHDGTLTYDTEYAVLETNGELGTIDTVINGPNVELTVTMLSAVTATINIRRLLFEV